VPCLTLWLDWECTQVPASWLEADGSDNEALQPLQPLPYLRSVTFLIRDYNTQNGMVKSIVSAAPKLEDLRINGEGECTLCNGLLSVSREHNVTGYN
jgi:hypothetical protein